jgi:hypothetical protein
MARQNIALDSRRLAWLFISAVVMLASAYAIFRWFGAVGTISGWIGLPQHGAENPRLRVQVGVWKSLALTLPFVAAVLLWPGRQKTAGFVLECCICFAASILGTSFFLLCLFLLGMLLHKLA